MSATLEALADATSAATVDQATIGNQVQLIATANARIKELEAIVAGPPKPPVDPPPAGGDWPTRPALPQMPGTAVTHNVNASIDYKASVDLKGETWIQLKGTDWQSLCNVAAASIVIRRARILSYTGNPPANGVHFSAPGSTVEDFDFLDNCGSCITVRAGTCTSRRVRVRTFVRYAIYVENQDHVIEDFTCEDEGADGILGTADDDAGSTTESVIRAGGCTGKKIILRRVRIVYGGQSRKACIRGDCDLDASDVYCQGAITGINPLNGGDGGRGWMIDRAYTWRGYSTKVNNPDETRRAIMKAAAAGERDLAKLHAIFMTFGKVDADPKDKSKGEIPIGKIMDAANVTQSMADRKRQLAERATSKWTRSWINFGYSAEHGAVATFDDKCRITGTSGNVDSCFTVRLGVYPEAASGSDPGWQLPGDVIRPETRINLNGTRCYGKELVYNCDEATCRRFIKGRFYFNDKLYDWA